MRTVLSVVLWSIGVTTLGFTADPGKMALLERNLQFVTSNFDEKSLLNLEGRLAAKLAQFPGQEATRLQQGILYHNLSAVLGSKSGGAAGKAVSVLEGLAGTASEEVKGIALGYLGSAWALSAQEATQEGDKINFVYRGFRYMDQAVEQYGEVSYFPRFLRANVAMGLPEFFEKLEVAGQDLLALEVFFKKNPGRAPMIIQSAAFNFLGDYYKKNRLMEKALESWKKAVKTDPQRMASGRAAAESLEIYGE